MLPSLPPSLRDRLSSMEVDYINFYSKLLPVIHHLVLELTLGNCIRFDNHHIPIKFYHRSKNRVPFSLYKSAFILHHADLQSFLKTIIKYELIKFISGHPYLPWEDGETSQCWAPARELDPCGLDQKTLSWQVQVQGQSWPNPNRHHAQEGYCSHTTRR